MKIQIPHFLLLTLKALAADFGHAGPIDFVENRNISNILEEAPLCAINWNLWGNSVGARDFSPDWKHRYFGTEVPCPDNDKFQFVD